MDHSDAVELKQELIETFETNAMEIVTSSTRYYKPLIQMLAIEEWNCPTNAKALCRSAEQISADIIRILNTVSLSEDMQRGLESFLYAIHEHSYHDWEELGAVKDLYDAIAKHWNSLANEPCVYRLLADIVCAKFPFDVTASNYKMLCRDIKRAKILGIEDSLKENDFAERGI